MAHLGGSREDNDKNYAQQEEQEAEDLAWAVVLPGVTVACCLEYDDGDDPNSKDDPGPEPQRASCRHAIPFK